MAIYWWKKLDIKLYTNIEIFITRKENILNKTFSIYYTGVYIKNKKKLLLTQGLNNILILSFFPHKIYFCDQHEF